MVKKLVKGNYAIAKAALDAGCHCYFGYPITPQSEISEYMSLKMPELGRVFVNAESELAAINMVIGAGSTGTMAMTSSSSCGIALMQEAISAMACAEIPGVIVNVMRAGPGLGDITPAQADYFQAVKGGGNGDYKTIVLAPSNIQEAIELTHKSFYLSMKYRNPVMLLADGMLGQMLEPVAQKDYVYEKISTDEWALSGVKDHSPRHLVSLHLGEGVLTQRNRKIFEKYEKITQDELLYEEYMTDDADMLITAFGTVARIAKAAIKKARLNGIKIGLLRPITLFPFPDNIIEKLASKVKVVLDIELNMGQMLQDVKAAIRNNIPIEFLGKTGGEILSVDDIYNKILELAPKKAGCTA